MDEMMMNAAPVVDVAAVAETPAPGAGAALPDPWDELAQADNAINMIGQFERAVGDAVAAERARCYQAVLEEINRGRVAGVPETSAAMKLLYRLAGAINNG